METFSGSLVLSVANFTAHYHLLIELQTASNLLCCDFLFAK